MLIMEKLIAYLGTAEGVDRLTETKIEVSILVNTVDYNQMITLLIREKYSLDDELSLNSKSMHMFLNNCTQEEKIRWTEQLKEFTAYRVECIRRAKEMCNMI